MRKTSLNTVYELAKKDQRVIFIGSDLGPDVLLEMKVSHPNQFIMEGVSEQHIVGMAAGLALEGFIPYVNTIATFLTRRCFEQVAIDICLQKLPVRLIANGGGAVYAPLGPTHLAVEDIAIMRSLPNMTVIAPCDSVEMAALIRHSLTWPDPIYIRMGKGGDQIISEHIDELQIGKSVLYRNPGSVLIISTGVMTQLAIKSADYLKDFNIKAGVLHVPTIKPLDKEALLKLIPKVDFVITIEEHSLVGGLGSAVLEFCSEHIPEHLPKISRMGIPDKFAEQYGSQESLLNYWGLTEENLSKRIITKLKEKENVHG
jgi:transketolase